MERIWIVLLEATRDSDGCPVDQETLQDLMAQMGCEPIVGLHHPDRYAIQLQSRSVSAPEALFSATARWADAVRRTGLGGWSLQRSEVLTQEEFERDQLAGEGQGPRPVAAARNDGDDLLRSAFHDALTGFPTLALFRDRANGIISRPPVSREQLALLVLDVDGLGMINREFGYVYGDQVLVELADRLADFAVSPATLARLARDEFVLLVDDTAGRADGAATELLDVVRAPMVLKGRPVVLTASIGIAGVKFCSDLDERLRRAGAAMGAAKEAGGDRWRRFEHGLVADGARLELLADFVPDRLAYIMLLERAALAANECASVEEASEVVLQQVLAHTGWRAGHLWLVAEDGAALRPVGVWRVSGPEPLMDFRQLTESLSLEVGEGLPGRVWQAARPEWTALREGDPRIAAAGQAALGGAVAFPVLAGAEVVAVLEFFSAAPIAPDEALLDVMAAVGAQLGRICERTRAAAALAISEERYRMLANSLPALIWQTGTDTKCTFVNRGWLDFTGRTAEEEAGTGWSAAVHPEDRARCLRTYLMSFSRHEPFEVEFRLRRADGQYRWLLSRGRPLSDGGVFSGYVGCCIDVTDRHEVEAEFRNEEARFRDLVANANVMIAVVGPDGTVLDEYLPVSNLGYSPGGERGRLASDYVHPEDRHIVAREFALALAEPEHKRIFEVRVRHADGSWRWLRAVAHNMVDNPRVGGVVYACTDITDYKMVVERLETSERELLAAPRCEAQISADVGHR